MKFLSRFWNWLRRYDLVRFNIVRIGRGRWPLMLAGIILAGAAGCARKEALPDFYEEIRSANKMVFASMAVTKTAGLDEDWQVPGTSVHVPGSKRIAVYSYDTYLEAYIDLDRLTPEDVSVDPETRRVTVTLPPIETELVGRDMELRREYDNIGMLRSQPDSKERARVKEIANAQLRREVEENRAFRRQLITAARRKARLFFESLIAREGYEGDIKFSN